MSSGYENVVGGKLKLKGKALDVKAASGGGIYKHKKKKKKKDKNEQSSHPPADQTKLDTSAAAGSDAELFSDPTKEGEEEEKEEEVGDAIKTIEDNAAATSPTHWDANLTPAERRYVEQRARIDMHRLAKTANKSHRDRIQDFNQYLANMSEHYDIPKVGPG